MLLDLLLGGLSRISGSLHGLDLGVVVRFDVDLFASITFNYVEESTRATRVLCHGAIETASFTRAYGVASSRRPPGYFVGPCRWELCTIISPIYRLPSRSYSAMALIVSMIFFTTPGATT